MNAVLIGGSYGIGRHIAEQLANEGYHVTVYARTLSQPFTHPSITWKAHDIGNELSDLPDSIEALAYLPGSINLKPFKSLKADAFYADLEVNLMGAVRTLHAAQAALNAGKHPSVVMFSTVAVQTGMAFHASIAAAKGAIEGLTRSLAAEWAPLIRVNAIAPSLTDTPLASRLVGNEARRDASAERHPLKRIGKPEDIASMATYLLSPRSSWITGQVLQVDGGISAIR